MYKGHRIIIFLVVFLCIVMTPLLMSQGRAAPAPTPSLDTPAITGLAAIEGQASCVEPAEYMRAEHMQLLNTWRTDSVRFGATIYTSSTGVAYEISLKDSCLHCHSNRTQFCDSCHTYAAVDLNCWNCHLTGEEAVGAW